MNKRYLLTLLCILLCGVIVCAKVQKKENHNISIDPKYPIELLGQTIKYNGKYIEINDRHLLVCPNLEDSVYYSRKYVYRSVKEAFQEIPDELVEEGRQVPGRIALDPHRKREEAQAFVGDPHAVGFPVREIAPAPDRVCQTITRT